MKSLLYKELKLSSLAVTYFFIAFGLMTFLPGYPILLGSFFVCMGIFYSFQFSRESNDPLFTVLLPVAKTDAVRAKFLFVLVVQGLSFLLMTICTLVRMTLLSRAAVYEQNLLSNANLFYLGFCLVMFGLFNLIFVRGYYKTAYKIGVPFIVYCAVTLADTALDFFLPPPCCLWASTRPLFTYRGLRLFRSRIFPLWTPKLSVFWRDLRFSPP